MQSQQTLLRAVGIVDDVFVDGICGSLAKDESANRNHDDPVGHHCIPAVRSDIMFWKLCLNQAQSWKDKNEARSQTTNEWNDSSDIRNEESQNER